MVTWAAPVVIVDEDLPQEVQVEGFAGEAKESDDGLEGENESQGQDEKTKHDDSDSNKSIGSTSGMWGVNLLAAAAVVALWEKIFSALAICALVMMFDLGRQIYELLHDDAAAVPEVNGATLVQDAADEVINEHGAVQDVVEEKDTYESHNGAPDLIAEMVQVANEVPSEHYPPLGDRSASSDAQPSTPDKPPTDEDDEFYTPLN